MKKIKAPVLRVIFATLVLCTFSITTYAKDWEVAVMFLGGQEPEEFQKDIDHNILELARLKPNAHLRLSIFREFTDRLVTYRPDTQSTILTSWDTLFFKTPFAGVLIPGEYQVTPADQSQQSVLVTNPQAIAEFFSKAFVSESSENVRVLLVYGHGLGYKGLRALELPKLRRLLTQSLPTRDHSRPLDVLWLNSCFMANLETAYELRDFAKYYVSSEEAEFSSGSPFESMALLETGPDDIEVTLKTLVSEYVDSYSYTQQGSQRRNVYSSSATLSLIDLEKIDPLVLQLKSLVTQLGGSLTESQREYFERNLPKSSVKDADMVDLARLLIRIKDGEDKNGQKWFPMLQEVSRSTLDNLEARSKARLRTNVRVALRPSSPGQWVIYGYNGFTRGYQGDDVVLDKLPENLKPKKFIPGPLGKSWPARQVNRRLFVAPFTVGFDEFNYVFQASDTQREEYPFIQTVTRTQDVFTFEAKQDSNPLRMSAYTQSIGGQAESYYGLSILNPLLGIPNARYLGLRFFNETAWGRF